MLKDSFKRGLGYQFARLLITLAIAFIIALLTGKVHALSFDFEPSTPVKIFNQNKHIQSLSTTCSAANNYIISKRIDFDIPYTNNDYDFFMFNVGESSFYRDPDHNGEYIDHKFNSFFYLTYQGGANNCFVESGVLFCPVEKGKKYTGFNFMIPCDSIGGTGTQYYFNLSLTPYMTPLNNLSVKDSKNTEEIKNSSKETEKNTKETKDFIKDDSDPNVDVSQLGGINGLLPAGPLDSLLALPINLITLLQNSTSGSCTPFTFNFVFDSEWTLPCFDEFWNQVPTALLLFLSDLPAVYIFIKWAKSIYKRVEKAVSFESSVEDEWGGV